MNSNLSTDLLESDDESSYTNASSSDEDEHVMILHGEEITDSALMNDGVLHSDRVTQHTVRNIIQYSVDDTDVNLPIS